MGLKSLYKIPARLCRIGNSAADYYRLYGLRSFLKLVAAEARKKYFHLAHSQADVYEHWVRGNEPSGKALRAQEEIDFKSKPLLTVVSIFPDGVKAAPFRKMFDSICAQTYAKWEFLYCSGAPADAGECGGKKINWVDKPEKLLSSASGDFIVFVPPYAALSKFSLFEIARRINDDSRLDFMYSDEDFIGEDSKRSNPVFKPEWSPDTLRSFDYINGFFGVEKKLLADVEPLKGGYKGPYDMVLRLTEKARNIERIPMVLFHVNAETQAALSSSRDEEEKAALAAHLSRAALRGSVRKGLVEHGHKVDYELGSSPLVSIVIPNRNHRGDLEKCVDSIITKSGYRNYEILIVENNSDEKDIFEYYEKIGAAANVRVIHWREKFNYSAINNFAAKESKGGVLLFLNNDTQVINGDWLERLLEFALRKDVGAVGAKLYYPDKTIQHAGIIMHAGGVASHCFRNYEGDADGYLGRLKMVQNLSAVTGACVMVRKEVFEEAGGFDESFPLTYNDVDLCLSLRKKGYLVVWTPYAELFHYEQKSRGTDLSFENKKNLFSEAEKLKRKWGAFIERDDPYYNPNLSQDECFTIKMN